MKKPCNPKGLSIVLSGSAGQGIQTVESMLVKLLHQNGFFVFSTKEYMSRVRGGVNSTEIRIAPVPVASFIDRIDILVALNADVISHLKHRISEKTMVLADVLTIGEFTNVSVMDIPLIQLAEEIGNRVVVNIIALGVLAAILQIEEKKVVDFVSDFFKQKKAEVVKLNTLAMSKGYQHGRKVTILQDIRQKIPDIKYRKKKVLLNGTYTIAFGAVAGGCTFIASYPMSPSTGVLTTLSVLSNKFNIIAEQAEDEIAAINMALGASYAGARSMVTTSGGGLALMTEGISLSGMLETPVVAHVAQRPGPATGLPTRSEQGDLELVLYAGHGEFPRIIYAPGTTEEGFMLTHRAFNMADKYQIPVFLLSDQYFVDSYYSIDPLDVSLYSNKYHIGKTSEKYQRYIFTDSGISPRGVPGFGCGFVGVDSDEHDTIGHISEDIAIRFQMVEKRLKKLESISKDTLEPTLQGPKDYECLVVCWGSTYHTVREALEHLDNDSVGLLHFSQVYPLHKKTKTYIEKAKIQICVENNATGQFHRLIHRETGNSISHKILKYDGHPFSVEGIHMQLQDIFQGEG
jgi:2-oxoglutarate ferredoxin oxidoreductase subunit alpha